jgi:4-hydroxy-tetrahydrodipicolinate synthase
VNGSPIAGLLPVIPTPFAEGAFDAESFRRLVEHMDPHCHGYTLLGSTGEAPSLTVDERMAIAEAALAMTPKSMDVVVGVSHTSATTSIELARHAAAHGAAAVLCSCPYYFPNTPEGALAFFREIDAAVDIDIVLYDNPVATKTQIAAADVVAWASELEHLNAVKLTDHDLGKIAVWRDAGLQVFAGDDPIAFRYLVAGVDGAMIIAPALCPKATRETWDALQRGDVEAAYATFARDVLPVLHVFGIGDEIMTTKVLLTQLGVFASAEVKPPLVQVPREREELLALALRVAGGERSEPAVASDGAAG